MDENLYAMCFTRAAYLVEKRLLIGQEHLDVFEIADLLYKSEEEKIEKYIISDKNIDYNDPIISIEEVGMLPTIDIGVTGDQLFYCNGVLTKNSWGVPQTADFMFAMTRSEELDDLGQVLIKQLKSRYNDVGYFRKFVIGIDISKFKFFDLNQSAQNSISDAGRTTQTIPEKKTRDFSNIVFD